MLYERKRRIIVAESFGTLARAGVRNQRTLSAIGLDRGGSELKQDMAKVLYSPEVTDQQQRFVEAIELQLEEHAIVHDTEWNADEGNGPAAVFRIPIRTGVARELRISVLQDSWQVNCGPCHAMVEAVSFDDEFDPWRDACLNMLTALMENPLRVRIPRFMRAGDIWFFVGDSGGWNGNAGFGREHVYTDWYHRR